jgi:hypothetical protein
MISFSTVQEISFFAVYAGAIGIMLYTCGRWILRDITEIDNNNQYTPVSKNEFDTYFTGKGYLVWDIQQDESTKKWNISLVKNKKIIEANGFSIYEIEKSVEALT